jgi:hypothetical protein
MRNSLNEDTNHLFNLCQSLSPSLDMFQRALSFHPLAFKFRDEKSRLPLHVVCSAFSTGGGSLEIIKFLVELYPESVKMHHTYQGDLPLHFACRGKAPVEVIQYLLKQWPESLKIRDGKDDHTPLQVACCCGASFDVVRYLFERWPESIHIGRSIPSYDLPLHCACKNGSPLGVIPFLVNQWPMAVHCAGSDGLLPLHHACMATSPLPLAEIQCLVQQWPESVEKKEMLSGGLPLHLACTKITTVGVIPYLVKQWPKAVKITDDYMRLPVHLACKGNESYENREGSLEVITSLDDIRCLVYHFPESVEHGHRLHSKKTSRDFWHDPNSTPLDIAALRQPYDEDLVNWLNLPWRIR